jgi:hypothetical protein
MSVVDPQTYQSNFEQRQQEEQQQPPDEENPRILSEVATEHRMTG